MSDLTERLRNHTIRFAHESEEAAKIRRNKAVAEAADEIDRLTRELAEARDALRLVQVPAFKQSMTYTGKDGWIGCVTFSFNSIEEVRLFISKLADAERILKEKS